MALRGDRSGWWRRFFGLSQDKSRRVVGILSQRYVEEMQQQDRLKQPSEKMHYPQFPEKLLQIAAENNKHAEQVAQRIFAVGGKLPGVPEVDATNENSWQQLLTALEEDYRSADDLVEQLQGLESDDLDLTKFLQQISLEQKQHRDEIRGMLMRSDSFAFSFA
jgi:bacterioferritin (cytochrome b1)